MRRIQHSLYWKYSQSLCYSYTKPINDMLCNRKTVEIIRCKVSNTSHVRMIWLTITLRSTCTATTTRPSMMTSWDFLRSFIKYPCLIYMYRGAVSFWHPKMGVGCSDHSHHGRALRPKAKTSLLSDLAHDRTGKPRKSWSTTKRSCWRKTSTKLKLDTNLRRLTSSCLIQSSR